MTHHTCVKCFRSQLTFLSACMAETFKTQRLVSFKVPVHELRFHSFSLFAATICFALAFAWLFAPRFMLTLLAVDGYTAAVGLVGRRCGALFLGIGVMFMVARRAPPAPNCAVMTIGFGATCVSLAALGAVEFVSGRAGFGILSAVAAELALAFAVVAVGRAERRAALQKYRPPSEPHSTCS